VRPWLLYTLVRLGIFAVLVAIFLLLGIDWWLGVPFAAVIAFLVSYLFLGRLRARFASELEAARTPRVTPDSDEAVEDRE